MRQLRAQAARREVSVRELLRESPDPTLVTVYFEDTVDVLGALLALVALILHRVTGSARARRAGVDRHRRPALLPGRAAHPAQP